LCKYIPLLTVFGGKDKEYSYTLSQYHAKSENVVVQSVALWAKIQADAVAGVRLL
jgi:hypothetical protein